ncbi:hypothetical protein FSPOR_8896 [Fusarium sporotrichioides]|uniref:Uncharacterized protein n=1 Tax=Fusarium sporotrichioides TaxID=5514 RepID=A0A395RS54_FUSSP|nr:hypothetical protein FSPOR_8896 [Fusarium sporotrichioides]
MIRNTLVFAALAANAAAGPCKPGISSTELLSTTIRSTETSYITESASVSSSAPVTTTTDEVTITTTTAADICVQSLIAPNGEPPLQSREADCEDLNRVTVSSYEVTQTVYKRGNVIIIPTAAIKRRAEGDEATTILPTATPDYATYCDSPTAYYDACSSLGITAFTTTIPEPTTTEVIITF